MIIELMNCVVLLINAFPPSSGVPITCSPHTLVNGMALDYSKRCKLPFGAYVETHEENNPIKKVNQTNERRDVFGPHRKLPRKL
jgi:hypothetical protein